MNKSPERPSFNDERGLEKAEIEELKKNFSFLKEGEDGGSLYFEWETSEGEQRKSYFMTKKSFPTGESIKEAIQNKIDEIEEKGGKVIKED